MPTIFEDDEEPKSPVYKHVFNPCRDPEHNPPSMIVIPPGKKMTHTCPACGKVTVVHRQITFGLNIP